MGEVVGRIERKGFRFVALELRTLDEATAGEHYAEHKDKPFFGDLVEFITGGPLLAGVIEGPEAIVSWRTMMGATNPVNAAPERSAVTSPPRCSSTWPMAPTPRSPPPARSRSSSPTWCPPTDHAPGRSGAATRPRV